MTTRESPTRHIDVLPATICLMPGCDRESLRAGYCGQHTDDRPTTCAASGCDRPAASRGYCRAHYQQVYVRGQPTPTRIGERKRRRTPEELVRDRALLHRSPEDRARLVELMRRLDVEAEFGACVGFAQQVVAMLEDTELDAQIPQPARARWKEGHRLADDTATERAGLRMQLGAVLEHPVLLVAAVRALHDKLGA